MCARHHSFRNICEMTRMPIVLICLTTVCIQILNNCVVADELQQQQSQRLGKYGANTFIFVLPSSVCLCVCYS